jgi:hypothetical protein
MLVFVQAGSVLAFSYTIPLAKRASTTTVTFPWKGEIGMSCTTAGITKAYCLNGQMKGNVYMVLSMFREVDEDTHYDYFIGQAYVYWTNTGGANFGYGKAPASLRISSTAANQGQYDADSTVGAPPSVCTSVSVGANIGVISLTATPNLCNSETQRLSSLSGTGATWTVNKVANSPRWDVWWMTKVKAGVVPAMLFTLTVPVYSVVYVSPSQQTYTRSVSTLNWTLR